MDPTIPNNLLIKSSVTFLPGCCHSIDQTYLKVCSLLLSHGADPTLLNCHSKSAIDVAPNRELQVDSVFIFFIKQPHCFFQERLGGEFKGHCLLDSCRQGDPQRLKKFLTAEVAGFDYDQQITLLSNVLSCCQLSRSHHPQVINFKQPYTGDSALHCAVNSPFPKRKSVAETLCRLVGWFVFVFCF